MRVSANSLPATHEAYLGLAYLGDPNIDFCRLAYILRLFKRKKRRNADSSRKDC